MIEGFRGIAKQVVIDLSSESGGGASLILLGDNGSGKSSICDALEFGLQARVSRNATLHTPLSPRAMSFAGAACATVKVELTDGTTIERGIVEADGEYVMTNRLAHSRFAQAAFVLRRADVLRFHEIPERDRQLLFLDYLGGAAGGEYLDSAEERIRQRRLDRDERKAKVASLVKELGVRLGVGDLTLKDVDAAHFEALLKRHLYRGLSPAELKRRRVSIKVSKPVQKLIDQIRSELKRIKDLKAEIKSYGVAAGVDSHFVERIAALKQILTSASETLTESFHRLSTVKFVSRLELVLGEAGQFALGVRVHLRTGGVCAPRQVFSEANLDLVALLVFLAVVTGASKKGQEKVLVLDDVLQSVDAGIRVSIAEYLLTEYRDWQLIFTVHDRLWHAQLRNLFVRHGREVRDTEIVRWSFEEGPTLRDTRHTGIDRLQWVLESGDPIAICAIAGLVLEEVANKLSWILATAVTRREGDRYTLGDVWPGVRKALGRTQVADIVSTIESWMHLRNIAGAHFNEWALGVSRSEAEVLGKSVLALLNAVQCPECGRWIEGAGHRRWSCRCGARVVSRSEVSSG